MSKSATRRRVHRFRRHSKAKIVPFCLRQARSPNAITVRDEEEKKAA